MVAQNRANMQKPVFRCLAGQSSDPSRHSPSLSLKELHRLLVSIHPYLLEELRQPLECLSITHSFDNTHHEEFHRSHTRCTRLGVASISHMTLKIQVSSKLILRSSRWDVNFVAKDHKWYICKGLFLQKLIQFLASFMESISVSSIDEENDAINSSKIVLPNSSCSLVTPQIKSLEPNVFDHELFRVRMKSGDMGCNTIILQHVKQGCLSSIVQTKEKNFCIF